MQPIGTTYFLQALTPVHYGGDLGDGVIDLPVAREAATGFPELRSPGIRRALKDEVSNSQLRAHLFGADPSADEEGRFSGALKLNDASLLCLPVRSLSGTFAWVSSPVLLHRLWHDLRDLGLEPPAQPPMLKEPESVLLQTGSGLCLGSGEITYLEELDLVRDPDNAGADTWGEYIASQVFIDDPVGQALFRDRFAVVHDAVLGHFCETALEVRPRVCLDDKGTVLQGPWYEEALPRQTLLWGVMAVERVARSEADVPPLGAQLETLPSDTRLQVGGNASIGQGQVRWRRAVRSNAMVI